MTSDNIFILQGLIERQMTLGKPLYICLVGFSKAFVLVNRNILFFNFFKSGIHGKVIDVLRSLYKKTYFSLKHHGLFSPPTLDTHGGNTSPTLFRHYLSNLGDLLFWYMRCVLNVKPTTSNMTVVGESGQIPPSLSGQYAIWIGCKTSHQIW